MRKSRVCVSTCKIYQCILVGKCMDGFLVAEQLTIQIKSAKSSTLDKHVLFTIKPGAPWLERTSL